MSKLDWTEDVVINLLEVYRDQEILWNPKDPGYHNKVRKHDAWEAIGRMFSCKGTEVKKKIDSLLGSFRRERQKSTKKTGMGKDEVYESTWFAYKHMEFLLDKFTPRKTIDTCVTGFLNLSEENQEDEVQNAEVGLNGVMSQSSDGVASPPSSTPMTSTSSIPIIKPKVSGKRKNREDQRASEAYDILKTTLAKKETKDASSIFGEYVATKHRSYSDRTRCVVEHMINNIFFEADMGKLDPVMQVEASSNNLPPNNNSYQIIGVPENQVPTREADNIIYVINSEE